MWENVVFVFMQSRMVKGCMEFNVFSWCVFYLECDKGRENSSYLYYI
jgi:hypothetical protein